MRRHDLVFALACLAALAHLGWVARGQATVRGGIQETIVDPEARENDAFALENALAVAPVRAGAGPDLVLIVLDGVRADMVGQMPSLARFATVSRSYGAARTPAPYAYASQASLNTGLLPSEHGATLTRSGSRRGARPGLPTLAGRLSAAGWLSVALSATRDLHAGGVMSGFDVALDDELMPGEENLPYIQGDRVTELALAALRARGDRPIFLQVRYADAELPWIVRQGACARAVHAPEALAPGGERLNRTWRGRRYRLLTGEKPANEAELETWRNAYASELCFLDNELGRLLDALPGLGVDEEDWVVVVGSHGVFLGEHGLVGGGWALYEEALRVPLFVRGPGLPPGQDDTPISTMNLARVLLAALGLPPLPDPGVGPPLPGGVVSELHGAPEEDLAPALRQRFGPVRRAVVLDGTKVILSSDNRVEAYDLREDPAESRDIAESERVRGLLAPYGAWAEGLLGLGGVR